VESARCALEIEASRGNQTLREAEGKRLKAEATLRWPTAQEQVNDVRRLERSKASDGDVDC